VLAGIVLAVFGSLGLGRFGYTSILPAMRQALSLTETQTGLLQSWNLVGYVLAALFAGILAARYGPRVVICVSLLVTALAMAATGLIPTFEGARVGRFLAGVGGAGGNIPAMALVSAWVGPRRRGLAVGAAVSGSSFGLMLTGLLVPTLVARHGSEGWRVSWYLLGALALGVLVVCALLLRNRPEELGLSPLAESPVVSARPKPGATVSSLQWSLVYRSRTLWHLAAIYFAFGLAYIIYTTFFIRYLEKEGGFGPGQAGMLWFKIGCVSIVSGFIWGGVADRWGRQRGLLCVFVLQGAAFLMFGLSRQLPVIYLSAGLFAVTAWSIPALMAALAGDVFGARLAPAALGLVTVVFGLGQALGPYLAGRIADATHSYAGAYVTVGLVALLLGAGGTMLLRIKVVKSDK
jgi:MFS family permease